MLDASVALKWFLRDEQYGEIALGLLHRFVAGELQLLAPSLLTYEIINGLVIAQRRGRIAEDKFFAAITGFINLDITLLEIASLHKRLASICQSFNRSAYDASYIVLAEREGIPLVTADDGLYQSVRKKLPWVKWIGDL